MRDVNDLGPGKFKTRADSGTEQICYYNRNKTDTSFKLFSGCETKNIASQ